MQDLNLLLFQSDLVWENPNENLARFDEKLNQIANTADLIVLPEMFNTGFTSNVRKVAEKPEGKSFRWLCEKAAEKNCVITTSILTDDGGKYYNRLYWVNPDGSYTTYDKRHLFRLGEEYKVLSAGMIKNIVDLKGWKILPLICYDLRFPVWCKNRFIDGKYEYDVILFVANWPAKRSYAWRQLLIGRAIENQAYAIGVNRIGRDGKNVLHSGDTMAVDFTGEIIGKTENNREECLSATLKYQPLNVFRQEFTVGLDWDKFGIF